MDIKVKRNQNRTCSILDTKMDKVELIFIGDIHYGHPACNKIFLNEAIKYVAEKDNRVWVGTGDYCETGLRESVGESVYEQEMPPGEQAQEIVQLFKPIKEKCLGLITGNHEDRVFNKSGVRLVQDIICMNLGVPFLGFSAWFYINKYKGNSYDGWVGHTRKASKNPALSENTVVRDIARWQRVDIIAKAHSHDCRVVPYPYYRTNKISQIVVEDNYWVVLTGHFLEREGSYIDQRGDEPKPVGFPSLIFSLDKGLARKVIPLMHWKEDMQ
jgi:predicted MPP superfamily phosphohydrolase